MNQKGFAPIILILILVAVIIGGSYYFYIQFNQKSFISTSSTTSKQNTNIKRYKNEQLGFEFLYPVGWQITEKNVGDWQKVILNVTPEKPNGDGKIALLTYDNPKDLSVKDFQEEINKNSEGMPPDLYYEKDEPVKISGDVDAFFKRAATCDVIPNCHTQKYIWSYNKKIYSLDSSYVKENAENQDKVFNQIFSTFKFTNQSSNADKIYNWVVATDQEKASWNTYTDSANHFSIQYPKEWWGQDKAYIEGEIVLTINEPCKVCGGVGRGVYISVFDNKNKLSSLDYVKQHELTYNGNPQPGFVVKNQPGYFSKFDAIVVDGMGGAGSPGPLASILNKDNKIIILRSDGVENDIVSKIFSTFKFLN